ncbi:MAG: restriction endonuclease subunit S, partial [Methylomicrobium sp.]|nr:restriction endonuclease subunit S [Methylomicrobium sp.]
RQQAIQLADEFLRSVFLDMFGDPNANPKGIDVKPMTEFFEITTGKLNSNAATVDGKYPFFTCAKEIFAINEFAFDQEALLLAGNNAQAEYDVKHYKGKFNAYQRTYVLTLKDKSNSYPFYKYALEYQLQNLKRVSKGTSTKYITLEIMERTMLPAPEFDLQNKFVEFYEKHIKIIGSNISSLEAINNNFYSLSQKAFAGEL